MNKKCTVCKFLKSTSLFNRKVSSPDGCQTLCRSCSRKLARDRYKNNINGERERIYARKIEIKERFKEFKASLECENCGESDPCCLDFHHKDPKKKDFVLSLACKAGYSWERLQEEIQKCAVVCANCHRKIHAGKLKV